MPTDGLAASSTRASIDTTHYDVTAMSYRIAYSNIRRIRVNWPAPNHNKTQPSATTRIIRGMHCIEANYRKVSNIRRTKSQNLSASRPVL